MVSFVRFGLQTVLLFVLCLTLPCTFTSIRAQVCDLSNYSSATLIAPASFPYTSPVTGITVSATLGGSLGTLGNTTYTCGSNSYACASTAWYINSTTQSITLTFSSSVNNFSVVVNGTNSGEVFTFTPSSGTATLSNYCSGGFSASGNQLSCTSSSTTGTLITVNNSTPVTQYVITHNGSGAGSRITLLDCFSTSVRGPVNIDSGIVMWLDGSNVNNTTPASNPTNNTAISTWKDVSGNNKNATVLAGQSTPVMNSAQINGKDVVKFTRSSVSAGTIYEVAGVDFRAAAMPKTTVFTVYKQGSNTSSELHGIWGDDNGNWDRFFMSRYASNNGVVSVGPPTNAVSVANSGTLGDTKLLTAVYDSGVANGSTIYFNAVPVQSVTDNTSPTAAQSNFRIGWDGDDNPYNGDIAEIIMYNRKLSDCEIKSINRYLGYKYGVTFTSATITPSPNAYFCTGGSATLTASAGTSYQWMNSTGIISGATASTYAASAAGSYRVIITTNGCSDTSIATTVKQVYNPLYVDGSIGASGTGASWASPLKTLTEALDLANNTSCAVEIWVKAGTYYPTTSTGAATTSRDSSFRILRNNIKVYGGFAGTETARTQRNVSTNLTTLSGDIGTANDSTDNSYHVMTIVGNSSNNIDTNTVVDGFTITRGNAENVGTLSVNGMIVYRGAGGGINTAGLGAGSKSSPLLENLTFNRNKAEWGGGLYGQGHTSGNSSPFVRSCSFIQNKANSQGGGMHFYTDGSGGIASPSFVSCTFKYNWALVQGGAGWTNGAAPAVSSPLFRACTLDSNYTDAVNNSSHYGGALTHFGTASSPSIIACTFTRNKSTYAGAIGAVNLLNLTADSSTFTANKSLNQGGGAISFASAGLTLSNSTFTSNTAATIGGAVSHYGNGPALTVTNCDFITDSAGFYGAAIYNGTALTTTITGSRFLNNYGAVVGAIDNPGNGTINIRSSVFSGNKSGQIGGVMNNYAGTSNFINCVLTGNATTTSTGVGGGTVHVQAGSTVNFYNSTLYNNTTASTSIPNGNALSVDATATLGLYNTIVWGTATNQIANSGTANYSYSDLQGVAAAGTNISVDPQFIAPTDPDGTDNIWATSDDGLKMTICSPAINTGDNALIPSGITTDVTAASRIQNTTVDMGAYEHPYTSTGLPAITISASPGTTICAGTAVTFNSIFVSPGNAPSYQWYKNGSLVASTNSYSTSALATNDTIYVVATNTDCNLKDTSNYLVMTVNPSTTGSVSLAVSPGTIVNPGTTVSFTATASNVGTTPSYQWKVNGNNVGTNATTYSNSGLANGDIVTCVVTSNASCPNPATVFSESTIWHIPTVTLTPSPACTDGTLTLTSTPPPSPITFTINSTVQPTIQASWLANATTVAGGNGGGTSANQFNQSFDCRVDNQGNVYVVDVMNHRIQKWSPPYTTGVTVAGGNGAGSAANQLNQPLGVDIDGSGNIYVTDQLNFRVQKWAPGASSGTTVAGGNGSGTALNQIRKPYGIVVDSVGNMYISDQHNHRVVKWAPGASTGVVVAGNNGNGTAANQLNNPAFIDVDKAGNVYVADQFNNRIQYWAVGATTGTTVAGGNGGGNGANQLNNCPDVDVDELGAVYILDLGNARVQRWLPGATSGTTIAGGNGTGTGANQFNSAVGIDMDHTGHLFVADRGNNRVQRFALNTSPYTINPTTAGTYSASVTTFGNATNNASAVTVVQAVTPSVVLAAAPSGAICSGTSVTFTATPTNGGTTPIYQWYKNSLPVGTGTNNYTDGALVNGDVISVRMISTVTCPSPDTVFATQTMVVNTTPTVSSSNGVNPSTCGGTNGSIVLNGLPANNTYTVNYLMNGTAQTTTITTSGAGVGTVANLGAGTYTNIVIVAGSGCSAATIAGPITLTPPATPSAPSASSNTPVCSGNSLNLFAGTVAGATYSWTGPNGFSASVQNPVISNVAVAAAGTYAVTVTVANCTSPAGLTTVVVNPTPVPSGSSSINPTTCLGTNGSITFSGLAPNSNYTLNYTKNGAGQPAMTLTTDASGNLLFPTLAAGLYANMVISSGACSSATQPAIVLADPLPPAAPAVTTNAPLCAGGTLNLGGPTNAVYTYSWLGPASFSATTQNPSITNVTTANSGVYSLIVTDTGTLCSSNPGSATVTVHPVSTITTVNATNPLTCGGNSGTISLGGLFANSSYTVSYQHNGGATQSATLSSDALGNLLITGLQQGTYSNITVSQAGCPSNSVGPVILTDPPIPPAPTASSNTPVCQGTALQLSAIGLAGATFSWTGPNSYSSSAATPVISSMQAVNAGTYSVTQTVAGCTSVAATTVVAMSTVPAAPAPIAGNTAPCVGTSETYSISAVPTATSYTWTIPATTGWSGTSTTNSISLAIGSASGTLSVTANNGCGSSAATTLALNVNATPAQPGAISGLSVLCAGTNTNYSVAPVPAATSYTWTVPTGWTGGGVTSRNINTTATATGGTVSVTATNACGTSPASMLAVNVITVPAQPGTISGNATPCVNSTQTYSVSAVSGATAYTWTMPAGGTPSWSGGSLTNSTSMTIGANSGNISVAAMNQCGTGPATLLPITVMNVPAQPGAIVGSLAPCIGNYETYSVPTSATASSYIWYFPSAWTGTGTTASAAALVGTTGGTITVVPQNVCGNGPSRTLSVGTTPVVTPTIVLSRSTPSDTICANTSVTFTATATNTGTAPVYVFRKNGVVVASAANIYTDNTLANGDVISVSMASSLPCVTYAQVRDSIKMKVNPIVVPGININSVPPITMCAGTSITLTTNSVGGGTAPSYQWYLNGTPITGAAGTSYNSNSITNGDTFQVHMITNAICAATSTAYSNKVGMKVSPIVAPTIAVTASPSGPVAAGTVVTFTATQSGGGATPDYQWLKNGVAILGETNATYTTSNYRTADNITVRMQSYDPCAQPKVVTATGVDMIVGSTSIAQQGAWDGSITLYPNPTTGHFTISATWNASHLGKRTYVDVLNVVGQSIYHTELKPTQTTWSHDVWLSEGLANGAYMLRLSSEDGMRSILPFVLNR